MHGNGWDRTDPPLVLPRPDPPLPCQADNCCKENRNRWIIGIYGYIIHLGWYDEVVLSFMVVG